MSDYSEDEANTPSRKSANRPKTRTIIRWSDEKLIIAFAEFRIAAQRHRIDIKKPLEDCAKAIAPTCTADALIQQLTKRRNRFLKESTDPIPPPAPVLTNTLKSTPKRRRTLIKAEDASTPSSGGLYTSPSSVPATRNSSRAKLKEELGLSGTASHDKKSPYVYPEPDSDSDYTDSPTKDKKKRVPKKARKSFVVEQASDDDFVDEVGGVYSVIEKPPTPPASQINGGGTMIEKPEVPRRASHQTNATSNRLGNISGGHGGYENPEKLGLINSKEASGLMQSTSSMLPQNVLGGMPTPFNMMNGAMGNPGMAAFGGVDTSGITADQQLNFLVQMMMAQGSLPTGGMNGFTNQTFAAHNYLSSAGRMAMDMDPLSKFPEMKMPEVVQSSAFPPRAPQVSKQGDSFDTISSDRTSSHDDRDASPSYARPIDRRGTPPSLRAGFESPNRRSPEFSLFDGHMPDRADDYNNDDETPRKKLAAQFDDFDMS